MKVRSLKQQFMYALECQNRFGISKRADRLNGIETINYIYSINEMKELKHFVISFARFLKERFPEVRLVSDIKEECVEAFVKEREGNWSYMTMRLKKHLFKKLSMILNQVYRTDLDFSNVKFYKSDRKRIKIHAMNEEDFNKLVAQVRKKDNCLRYVPEITASIGTRIEELCSITYDDIDLDKRMVSLNNCKNGRNRIVPIDPRYLELWKTIKTQMRIRHWSTVTAGVSPLRIITLLRQAMIQAGISENYNYESNHSIRKMYARRRFKEERNHGFGIDKSWTIVQGELGHGPKSRADLYKVYIGRDLNTDLKEERDEISRNQ